jgi:hypothetical protein
METRIALPERAPGFARSLKNHTGIGALECAIVPFELIP